MKKISSLVCLFLVSGTFLTAATSAGAPAGGLILPVIAETPATPTPPKPFLTAVKDALGASTDLLLQEAKTPKSGEEGGPAAPLSLIESTMRTFKKDEAIATKKNIESLEKLLVQVEKQLAESAAEQEFDVKLPIIAKFVKIQSALEGERQVLACIEALPEKMQNPSEELGYGYAQAKNTLDTLDKVSRDTLLGALEKYREAAGRKDDFTQPNSQTVLREARDVLTAYYGIVQSLYKDFQQVLEGLWVMSGRQYMSVQGRSADKKKAIWQGEGYTRVNKRELIQQREADMAEAKRKDTTMRKTGSQEEIQSTLALVNAARDVCERDQGRLDLEEILKTAQESLQEIIDEVNGIDVEDCQSSDRSRAGLRVLLREAALFKGQESVGNSLFGAALSGISKHVSLFKDMQPVRAEFEMRLRGVGRMYPGIALSLPLVRVVVNRFAPGILEGW